MDLNGCSHCSFSLFYQQSTPKCVGYKRFLDPMELNICLPLSPKCIQLKLATSGVREGPAESQVAGTRAAALGGYLQGSALSLRFAPNCFQNLQLCILRALKWTISQCVQDTKNTTNHTKPSHTKPWQRTHCPYGLPAPILLHLNVEWDYGFGIPI